MANKLKLFFGIGFFVGVFAMCNQMEQASDIFTKSIKEYQNGQRK
jgi:hypothetical protein